MVSYSMTAAHERFSGGVSFRAPTMGINDLDAWPAMPPEYCISMVNWYPGTYALATRGGYKEWVTGLTGSVRSLLPYYAMDGGTKLFAATDTKMYDVTASADSPTPLFDVGNGDIDFVQFATVAATYLVAVNATDSGWLYDGTNWIPFAEADPADAPGKIKGVDPKTFETVTSFKRRLWFTQEDSLTAWYLPVDAVAGEAKPFYLGSVFRRGGSLAYVAAWSMDAGEDLRDRLLFMSSTGEAAIYSGNNPDDANDWRLDALYTVPPPTGIKGYTELGGDLILLTRSGLLPLSRVVSGEANAAIFEATISKMINRTLTRQYLKTGTSDEWQLLAIQSLQAVVVNIPGVGDTPSRQYVMNALTGAWTEYTLPATVISNYLGSAYFGGAGKVYIHTPTIRLDGVKRDGSGGLPIQCSLFSAFSDLESPGSLKHFKMIRPIFQGQQTPSYKLKINVDYDVSALAGNPPNPPPSAGAYLWDSALWDSAFWSSGITVTRPWSGIKGLGYDVALLLRIAATEQVSFVAGQVIYEEADGI